MRQSVRYPVEDFLATMFVFLFIYAALSKLIDIHKFQVQLGQSPILTRFAFPVSYMVPLIEIMTAVLLSVKRYQLAGFYISFSLMTMFTAYIIIITSFSEYIPCSCGGILQNMSWGQHLLFNIFFVLIALIAILFYKQPLLKPTSLLQ